MVKIRVFRLAKWLFDPSILMARDIQERGTGILKWMYHMIIAMVIFG